MKSFFTPIVLLFSLVVTGCASPTTPSVARGPSHGVRFGTGGYGNTIYDIQVNTTALTPGNTWTAVTNATAITAGKYIVFFDNEGSTAGYYSLDGVHAAGRIPVSTAVTDNYITVSGTTFTIYVESAAGSMSGLYVWGHQLF